MILHWPQFIILALLTTGLGFNLAKHGEPRDDKYNVWASLSVWVLYIGLLYAGGFFGGV